MWEKCVSCGEGLFAGDAFCGNCGRPTTPAVPPARESAGGQFTRPDSAPEPAPPALPGEPDGPPQLELGLGLAPALGAPVPASANGQLTQAAAGAGQPAPPVRPGPADGLPGPGEPPGRGVAATGQAGPDRDPQPTTEADLPQPGAPPSEPAGEDDPGDPLSGPAGVRDPGDPLSEPGETGGPGGPSSEPGGVGGPGGPFSEPGGVGGPGDPFSEPAGVGGPDDPFSAPAGMGGPDDPFGARPGVDVPAGLFGGVPGADELLSRQSRVDGAGQPLSLQAGVDGAGEAGAAGPAQPEPEMLIIPARQVGGPTGPGGRLTVPAQRRGQPSPPGRPAAAASRLPQRTRLSGQANPDPVANSRFLLRVGRQAAMFAGVYVLTETVLLIVFLGLRLNGLSLHSAFRLEAQSLWLVGLVLASLFWAIPVPALLGQWSMLVENSADASSSVFEHIATAFREHDAPLDVLDVRTVSPPRESARDYLELRRGRFSGFIACFPHGRDLYVGWTFFLRMSPARLVLVSAGRSAAHLTRRGGDIRRALYSESARALVAAMHSATLAGIGAAVSAPDPAAETADSPDDVVVKFG